MHGGVLQILFILVLVHCCYSQGILVELKNVAKGLWVHYVVSVTMYVKQCDCLKPCLRTTTFVDDRTSLIHYTFFKTKYNLRSLKKYFIDKYIYLKILSLIQNIFNI
jgi:hypothetical protein